MMSYHRYFAEISAVKRIFCEHFDDFLEIKFSV